MKTPQQKQAFRVLAKAEWLEGYDKVLAERLVTEGQFARLSSGEWAQAEGDDRGGLYVVIGGLLHTYYAPLNDRVIMVGLAEPGAVLGHATRYSGGPRLVTAVCAEESVILEISENALDRIAVQSPEIWRAIADLTYSNMQRALRLAAEIVSLRPNERIAARLVAIAKPNAPDATPTVKISQELLGEMVGVTRKTVNQHLSKFEQSGLIRLGYGRIDLIDIAKLKLISTGHS